MGNCNSNLKNLVAVLCLLLLSNLGLNAEQSTVNLDMLVTELLKNNPEIQAAESRYRAALARPSQLRTLPDPVVSFVSVNMDGNPVPFTTLGEDSQASVGLMLEQEFPFPGKLKLAGQVAEKEAVSIGAEVDAVKSLVISQLKQAYYEYFRADRTLEILTESMDFLKRFESIAEQRYSVGQTIQQDVLRAQVEISILNQRITTLQQENGSAIAEINRLLNRPIDSPIPKPVDMTLSVFSETLEELEQEYAIKAPMIRANEAMLQREKLNLDLAKKQYKPDFMSSVEYGNTPNFPDMWRIQFGLRIPIYYKKKQQYGVLEATQNVKRAEKELRASSQEIGFSVKDQYLKIESSGKLIRLYQQAIIPQSNLALESGIASYQVGKADFLTTISNFLTLLEYEMNYFEELAKHESAIARMEQAVGRSLTMNAPAGGNHE